jgi:hypothetical protein
MSGISVEGRTAMKVPRNSSWTRVAGLFAVAAILSGALMSRAATTQEEKTAENPLTPNAGSGHKASYYVNGEIHVNVLGALEGKPLTSGHMDFKPSWSKTDNRLVFFRRLKDDPVTVKWITAICIIGADGTGFHQLTDGTHTDFNPTWTRDGLNTLEPEKSGEGLILRDAGQGRRQARRGGGPDR